MLDVGDAELYTTPVNQPRGARIPEFVLRQLIGFGLQQIRQTLDDAPVGLIDELFAMHGLEIVKQVKSYFRQHPNIKTTVNWPTQDDLHTPFIAVLNQSENEDPGLSFLGDNTGQMSYGVLGGGKPTARAQLGVGLKSSTNIYVAADDQNLAMYLYHIVRYILFSNKLSLTKYFDLHNLVINGAELTFDERFLPIPAFYKLVSVQYQMMFDYNLPEEAAHIVSLDLMVSTQQSGVEVIVDVPYP